jgi:hypothetical protein
MEPCAASPTGRLVLEAVLLALMIVTGLLYMQLSVTITLLLTLWADI